MTDNKLYCFTEKQLYHLLRATLDLYDENQAVHGKSVKLARLDTITGTVDGLDSEAELLASGEKLTPTFTLLEAAGV